jgi:hypothetical protein
VIEKTERKVKYLEMNAETPNLALFEAHFEKNKSGIEQGF